MTVKYRVNWDNGNEACGTFPEVFETEEDAQAFADDWANEMNWEDLRLTPEQVDECGGEDCYTAEVIEVESDDEEQEELFDPVRWGWVGKDGRP